MRALDRIMQERIAYGGALFTRAGLVQALRERGYSARFIDYWCFSERRFSSPENAFLNNKINEVPESFWED